MIIKPALSCVVKITLLMKKKKKLRISRYFDLGTFGRQFKGFSAIIKFLWSNAMISVVAKSLLLSVKTVLNIPNKIRIYYFFMKKSITHFAHLSAQIT